jgi:hypothetical protein
MCQWVALVAAIYRGHQKGLDNPRSGQLIEIDIRFHLDDIRERRDE